MARPRPRCAVFRRARGARKRPKSEAGAGARGGVRVARAGVRRGWQRGSAVRRGHCCVAASRRSYGRGADQGSRGGRRCRRGAGSRARGSGLRAAAGPARHARTRAGLPSSSRYHPRRPGVRAPAAAGGAGRGGTAAPGPSLLADSLHFRNEGVLRSSGIHHLPTRTPTRRVGGAVARAQAGNRGSPGRLKNRASPRPLPPPPPARDRSLGAPAPAKVWVCAWELCGALAPTRAGLSHPRLAERNSADPGQAARPGYRGVSAGVRRPGSPGLRDSPYRALGSLPRPPPSASPPSALRGESEGGLQLPPGGVGRQARRALLPSTPAKSYPGRRGSGSHSRLRAEKDRAGALVPLPSAEEPRLPWAGRAPTSGSSSGNRPHPGSARCSPPTGSVYNLHG